MAIIVSLKLWLRLHFPLFAKLFNNKVWSFIKVKVKLTHE